MSNPPSHQILVALPGKFPDNVPPPKLKIGDRVRWYPLPTQDFGIITGLEYAPTNRLPSWNWRYVVWLDARSPSYTWVSVDTAWEEDLEVLPESKDTAGEVK